MPVRIEHLAAKRGAKILVANLLNAHLAEHTAVRIKLKQNLVQPRNQQIFGVLSLDLNADRLGRLDQIGRHHEGKQALSRIFEKSASIAPISANANIGRMVNYLIVFGH